MKKPKLDNLSPEQLQYVEYLEACKDGTSNLIASINLVNDAFAKELVTRIDSGGLLADEDFFDQYIDLIGQIPKLKAMYTPEKGDIIKPTAGEEHAPDNTANMFEATAKKVRERLNGGAT